MAYRITLACFVGAAAALIMGVGNVYTNTDGTFFVKKDNVPEDEVLTSDSFVRYTDWFKSKGVRCHAWLYLPSSSVKHNQEGEQEAQGGDGSKAGEDLSSRPPVVIMGHGLGSQKDMGLAKYAEYFASRDIASFVIDYRTLGGSDGMPRNLIDPWRHIEDFQSALDHIRTTHLDGRVDGTRVALWGTSFAGGHVLHVAASDVASEKIGEIRAVVSQVPHLDGRAASKRSLRQRGMLGAAKMAVAAIGDTLRGLLRMEARYVSIVGHKGDVAIMLLTDEEYESYFQKHPVEYLGGWKNMGCARIGAMMGLYSPIHVVDEVTKPILFIAGSRDEICPPDIVRAAAEKSPTAKLSIHDSTHFDIYRGAAMQAAMKDMGDFLEEHLEP